MLAVALWINDVLCKEIFAYSLFTWKHLNVSTVVFTFHSVKPSSLQHLFCFPRQTWLSVFFLVCALYCVWPMTFTYLLPNQQHDSPDHTANALTQKHSSWHAVTSLSLPCHKTCISLWGTTCWYTMQQDAHFIINTVNSAHLEINFLMWSESLRA